MRAALFCHAKQNNILRAMLLGGMSMVADIATTRLYGLGFKCPHSELVSIKYSNSYLFSSLNYDLMTSLCLITFGKKYLLLLSLHHKARVAIDVWVH